MSDHSPGLFCLQKSSKFSSNEAASRPRLEILVLSVALDRLGNELDSLRHGR